MIRGPQQAEPQSHKGQSEDVAMRMKEVKDGEGKHAEMWRLIEEARGTSICTRR